MGEEEAGEGEGPEKKSLSIGACHGSSLRASEGFWRRITGKFRGQPARIIHMKCVEIIPSEIRALTRLVVAVCVRDVCDLWSLKRNLGGCVALINVRLDGGGDMSGKREPEIGRDKSACGGSAAVRLHPALSPVRWPGSPFP